MFPPSVDKEVHYVREVLEGAFAPEVASTLMFEVLAASGAMPSTTEEVLAFCRGPLADAIEARVGAAARGAILERLEQVLVRRDWSGTDIPIDVDEAGDLEATRVMPTVWREPVVVLVVAATGAFAELLSASLGRGRVAPHTVDGDGAELRRAVFALEPLLFVVDATAAPSAGVAELVALLRGLPDSVAPVVWGTETEYGAALIDALREQGVVVNGLRYGEGVGPLLDLILARRAV